MLPRYTAAVVTCVCCLLPASHIKAQGIGTMEVLGRGNAWTPMTIERVNVAVTVRGRFARTRVEHVFRNHLDRQTEAIFRFRLPAQAAISRLVMDVEGKMVEGELVERVRAREIYDRIVSKRRDPALLEHLGNGRYQLSVFPVPARGTKTVVLVYDEILPQQRGQILYHYGPPTGRWNVPQTIGRFQLTLKAAECTVVKARAPRWSQRRTSHRLSIRRRYYRPRRAIRVTLRETERGMTLTRFTTQRRKQYFAVRYAPRGPVRTEPPPTLIVALDTSASMGHGNLRRISRLLFHLLKILPRTTKVNLVHGDLLISSCADRPLPRARWRRLHRCLSRLTAAGASNLGELLSSAVHQARRAKGRAAVLAITDGTPSVGEQNPKRILQNLRRLTARHEVQLFTLTPRHTADDRFVRELASELGGTSMRLSHESPRRAATRVLRDLHRQPLRDVQLKVTSGTVTGLTLVRSGALEQGEPIFVLGQLKTPQATLQVRARLANRVIHQKVVLKPTLRQPARSMIANFWARARLRQLERQGMSRKLLVERSLTFGIMSPYTSFLVLEGEQAYRRWGIVRRKALAQESSRGAAPGGRAVVIRRHRSRAPVVFTTRYEMAGNLDSATIRRYVRRHLAQVRHCYNLALQTNFLLNGTLKVAITVTRRGRVGRVQLIEGLGHSSLSRCVKNKIRRWRFPVSDQMSYVVYPFHLVARLPAYYRKQVASMCTGSTVPEIAKGIETDLGQGNRSRAIRCLRQFQTFAGSNSWLPLVRGPRARKYFRSQFERAARRRLEDSAPPRYARASTNQLFVQLVTSYLQSSLKAILSLVRTTEPDPDVARSLMTLFIGKKQHRLARQFTRLLLRKHKWRRTDACSMLLTVASGLPRTVLKVCRPSKQPDVYLQAALDLRRYAHASRVLRRLCPRNSAEETRERCLSWFQRKPFRGQVWVRTRLAAHLKHLLRKRRRQGLQRFEDMAGLAQAFLMVGNRKEGLRYLSELLEKKPSDPRARQNYAAQITRLGLTTQKHAAN